MSILDSIGNTPLVELKNIWPSDTVRIFAKVEGMNPGGSIKDRVALQMILEAIKRKELKPGMAVLEATSGNTGIGLAMVCAALKIKCNLVMPKTVSKERFQLCAAFGANNIKVDGGTDGAIEYVKKQMLINQVNWAGYYNPNQFDNPDNWKAHFLHTGPEIVRQLQNQLNWSGYSCPNPTVFVASCGTTGTITGCKTWFDCNHKVIMKYHRQESLDKTKTIAVFPRKNSKIQGLKNLRFQKIPKIYNKAFIDERVMANDQEAFNMTKKLAREEGIFCGVSSGAAMCAAIREATKMDSGWIVVILPDNGYRYLTEKVF